MNLKFSDQICLWLKKIGYTNCFYVQGGHIMHLVNSAVKHFKSTPFIHEGSAVIAAEYFNANNNKQKAFALVTSGPGVTNCVSGISGAYLESRELLVIGGQVKTQDISNGERQYGIQENDSLSICRPVTKISKRIKKNISHKTFIELVSESWLDRKGPVFLEIPIDLQGAIINKKKKFKSILKKKVKRIKISEIKKIALLLKSAQRPSLLLGGGINKFEFKKILKLFHKKDIPLFTTWNGSDLIPYNYKNYFGRPNWFGQRCSNILVQQSDLLVAIGTRMGLQQTGFNVKQFLPNGKLIQIDIDKNELLKKYPKKYKYFCCDAVFFIKKLLKYNLGKHERWIKFCNKVKNLLPNNEKWNNKVNNKYISSYVFYNKISNMLLNSDKIVPCSSGGAFTSFYQSFKQKRGQIITSNKGLASMGYGLAGAIGTAFANKNKRTILFEGDGGFSQNLQEIGTVKINKLNIKMFIFDDLGYASIRMTQKNYFRNKYVGCDTKTGVYLPNWKKLFNTYGIAVHEISKNFNNRKFNKLMNNKDPAAFIVKLDPKQTYYPKISSRISKRGIPVSDPLHKMTPPLKDELMKQVCKFIIN